MNKYCKLLIPAVLAGGSLFADIKIPAIFSTHAVLQKSSATAVFGKADPGEEVKVIFGNASASTTAGKDGKWLVKLDLSNDDGSAKVLQFIGRNKIHIRDVITGEVWLAAGQSNMEFRIPKSLNGKEVIKNSENPNIRTFKAYHYGSLDPDDTKHLGSWYVASPKGTGYFSAVAYHFARKVNAETGKTIGLVDPAWGSSSIEAWMSHDTLMKKSTPAVAETAKKDIEEYTSYDGKLEKYTAEFTKWAVDCNRIDEHKNSAPPATAKWSKRKTILGRIRGNGIVWFRKTISVGPKDYYSGKRYVLQFGSPNVPVEFYLDGKKIAAFPLEQAVSGKYFSVSVPAADIQPGQHELTLKANAAIPFFSFGRLFVSGSKRADNSGNWETCREKNYAKLTSEQQKNMPAAIGKKQIIQKVPTTIWNSMMAPIVPYTMRGVIWYQGESNSNPAHAPLYAEHQRAFVEQLREAFCNPELYYYTVQLSAYMSKSANPAETGNWPALRQQQEITSLNVKNSYHVSSIDCGEEKDIHPIDKTTVGERLANVALANVYGKNTIQWKNPRAVSAVRQNNAVKVDFADIYDGLEARKLEESYWVNRTRNLKSKLVPNSPGSEVEGFALQDKSGNWFWADAKIDGSSVIVSSAKVKEPVKVRYAWQNNPTCNLFSKSGLPVSSLEIDVK